MLYIVYNNYVTLRSSTLRGTTFFTCQCSIIEKKYSKYQFRNNFLFI